MNKFLLILKGFIMILILILTASVVNAQKTAIADGNWNAPGTWAGGVPPTAGETVTINNGVDVTVTVAAQCSSVTFGSASGSISVDPSIILTITNGITLQNSATINTAATLSGAGAINCASVSVGGTVAPTDNNLHTTILTSTITALSITGNLTLSGQHGTGNRRNAPTFNLGSGNVTVSGTAVLAADDAGSGATLTLAFAPQTGTLTLLGATPLTIDANSNFIANGTSATVNYSGTTQTVSPITYTNLTLMGSGAKTLTGTVINGTLSIQGTATTLGTSPTYGASAILEYKGSAAQTISTVEFGGTGANPANLRIDNTNGVTLNSSKTINGALTLINGYLTTTGLLTIGTAGSATTSNGAFVNGQLAKMTASIGAAFTFPVGTIAGGLRTIGITTAGAGATTYTAQFFKAKPQTTYTGSILSPLVRISSCEYWVLDRSTAGTPANAAVTLSWTSNSCGSTSGVTDPPTLLVAKYNGTNWVSEGNASNTSSTVTSNAVSSFSPFTLGSSDAGQNPLPVVFANVKAYEKNGGVQIEWSNMTESDVASYTVERSNNGQNFTSVSQHSPKSNLIRAESYVSFDASPFTGVNLYRIKVLENSGKIVYSKILRVDINNNLQSLSLYPNPVRDNLLSVGINAKQGQYNLRVLNNAGQQIYSKLLVHQGGNLTQTIELPSSVKPGIYNMVVSGDNFRQTKMFIIQ